MKPRVRVGAFVLAIAAAAGLSFWATRDSGPAESATAHAHGAAAPAGEAMPVTLRAGEQGRIGITFGAVVRAPLDRSVRTVAQVTYDETRVKTIAPLID